eukprot:14867937-Heterocapsa_arctica.AAC.1
MKDGSDYIHVCYEWPRNNAGWGLDVMKELRQLLPHEVLFDGCCYCLMSYEGELLRKPWRV